MEMKMIDGSEAFTHVVLSGRLDLQGVQMIDQAFTFQCVTPKRPLIVDMSEVSFLASMGIRMFLSAAKALSRSDCKLILAAPQPDVKNALTISGMANILCITDSLDEAKAILNQ